MSSFIFFKVSTKTTVWCAQKTTVTMEKEKLYHLTPHSPTGVGVPTASVHSLKKQAYIVRRPNKHYST